MNKKIQNINLKEIISKKKTDSTKLSLVKKNNDNYIKSIVNINIEKEKINDDINKENKQSVNKNKNENEADNKYYEFKAHFKYNELVKALSSLKDPSNSKNIKNNDSINNKPVNDKVIKKRFINLPKKNYQNLI